MKMSEILTPIVTPEMSDEPDAQKIFDNLKQLDEKAIANCNAVYSDDIVRQTQLNSSLVADRIFYDGQTYGHFSINAENVANAIGAVDAQVHMMTQGKDMYAKYINVDTTAATNYPLHSTVQEQFESQDKFNKQFFDHNLNHAMSINIIENKLGDIDTALDKIIEIQNTLIGGGE